MACINFITSKTKKYKCFVKKNGELRSDLTKMYIICSSFSMKQSHLSEINEDLKCSSFL